MGNALGKKTNKYKQRPERAIIFDKLRGGFIFKVYYSPLISVFDFFNKDKFYKEINQMLNRTVTEEEILNLTKMGITGYPTTKNSLEYFGVSIGYRF